MIVGFKPLCSILDTYKENMKKRHIIFGLCLLVMLGIAGKSSAREKVAWFNSGSNSLFWPIVEQIMVAAAKDLEMELDIYRYKEDPFYMITLAKEVMADPARRPDCILMHNFKKRGETILELGEKFGVPVFIFNAGFGDDSSVGKPREKYSHWIGQILPDDEYGGYLLANELIVKARNLVKNQSTPIQMVALEGNRTSGASIKRVAGLKRALAEHPEVVVNQYFHSKWKKELAKEAFQATQRRYPQTTVFWAASETMAIGVIEAAKEQGLFPGKDMVAGGFDLLPDNKKYIESGEMTASVGGHYFEAAWALVLIHDYLNGVDFASGGATSFISKMASQTKDDLTNYNDIYLVLSTSLLDTLDFGRLSKHRNPAIEKYNFDLDAFLKSATNH